MIIQIAKDIQTYVKLPSGSETTSGYIQNKSHWAWFLPSEAAGYELVAKPKWLGPISVVQ
jgi:hypothetical protein